MMHSSEEVMSEIFAECVDMLMSGAPPADCYKRFPEHASELEELLGTTARLQPLRAVPPRDPAVAAARRNDFMSSAYALSVSHNRRSRTATLETPASWLDRLATRLFGPRMGYGRQKSALFSIISYLLLIAFTGILISGAAVASAGALPGDLLYPVKTARESVQIFLTRDATARADLEEMFQERRVEEIKTVLERRLSRTAPLSGTIEQITTGEWIVSGLRITLTADTLIEGRPEVGATVEGRVRAPGDGSLVALRIEVTAQSESKVVVAETPAPLPTPKPATATNRPRTATPPPAPTAEAVQSAVISLPTVPVFEPVEPTATSTPSATLEPSVTPTRTKTPTRRPTATAAPKATLTPVNRGKVTGMVSGTVMAIDGNRWLINEVWVETFDGTRYGGNPRLGGHVDVFYELRDNRLPLATEIIERNLPPTSYYPVTGTVVQIGETWSIDTVSGGLVSFRVTDKTQFVDGQPGIGDTVTVDLEDGPGGRVALKVTRIFDDIVVTGAIEKMEPYLWIIGGWAVHLDSKTVIVGNPVVGAYAKAEGYESADGSKFIARKITIQ